MRQLLDLFQRNSKLFSNFKESLRGRMSDGGTLCLDLVCDLFFEREGHVEELLVVDVLLLRLKVENLQTVYVLEL